MFETAVKGIEGPRSASWTSGLVFDLIFTKPSTVIKPKSVPDQGRQLQHEPQFLPSAVVTDDFLKNSFRIN
jgi:hypothetical protein